MRNASLVLMVVGMTFGGALNQTARAADEVGALLKEVNAPARFANHTPNFSQKAEEVDQVSPAGPSKLKIIRILDGDRQVAIYVPSRGELDVISFDPTNAPTTAPIPPRYHWATCFNARMTTVPWAFGWAPTGDQRTSEVTGGGKTITITERQTWTKRKASAEHLITIGCDPVTGYVVTFDCKLATADGSKKGRPMELVNWLPVGASEVWPGKVRFDRTVYTPPGGGIKGWFNNLPAADKSDNNGLPIRAGGFVAFLPDANGWAQCMTRDNEAPFSNATCNVWQDQHTNVTLSSTPDDKGNFTAHGLFRLLNLPPEVAAEIAKRAEMNTFGGETAVMVRLGQMEDFEEQPFPLTSTVRGGWAGGLQVSTEQARSGKKSLLVNGTPKEKVVGHTGMLTAPQILLDFNARYRIEAWVKVVGDDTDACISADLYEYSPHDPKRLVAQKTNVVKAGAEWQKLELEFDGGPLGLFSDLRFMVVGSGKAYFDDFSFTKIK